VRRILREWHGFTILELMVAMGIFMIICGAMFELLNLSQKKYNSETQLTAAYQDAHLAMDQIVRDFNMSGYPPAGIFSIRPPNAQAYAISPIAWSPGYNNAPPTPCQVGTGGTCATPGDYDLIIETRLSTDTNVSWIWYHLDTSTNTLSRAVVQKAPAGADPLATVQASNTQVAFLVNVVNNSSEMTDIKAEYSAMFPGGQPQPIFQYTCDTPSGAMPCSAAGAYNSPQNIRDLAVTLIVITPQRDSQTQSLKLIELTGSGHRVNPVN